MPKKIFELAKDLNMGPLDLVEDLKAKGFPVRNHMTALSDEDVENIVSQFKAKADESEAASKKATKKKTAKKKVAKKTTKKVVKKAAAGDKVEASEEDKPTVVRKKAVIRRKTSDKAVEETPEVVAAVTEEIASEEVVVEEAVAASAPEVEATKEEESSGLRVVSKPVAKEKVVEEVKVDEPVAKKAETSDVYREKVHKFTPVYIPPKEEAKKETTTSSSSSSSSSAPARKVNTQVTTEAEGAAKKKIGGLASMMSGKKAAVSKSQVLTQTRADSEMKSYGAVSGTGRPLYTQVVRRRAYTGPSKSTKVTEVKDSKRVVKLHDGALAEQLAKKLSVKLKDMIDKCLDINLLLQNGDYIGLELCAEISALYGYRVENVAFDEDAVIGKEKAEDTSGYPVRDPIITIMGHVDHGKTTLLDHIRSEKVASGEAGGITQHIGAYSVESKGKKLTFLDTPGHAAFASMRQRGADLTDIVVLVVAADDGVMPQTKESIKFCNNANKPVIIAVNKMDKEGVNPDRIKTELSEFGITPEDWGGDTPFCHISALKGDGVDELLEAIALQAEMMELRANEKGGAEGIVIESKIEAGRGPVATVLVQKGTLKKGDSIVVGETYGRARSLTDHVGGQQSKAGPSVPVQILGLDEAPSPGQTLNVVKNEREAKKIAQNRIDDRKKLSAPETKKKMSLEDFFASASEDTAEKKKLNLIIRSDVQGSYEAIKQAVEALSNSEVEVAVIAGGVGAITDSDVNLAETSAAYIMGFNMRPLTTARRLTEQAGIDIKTYTIIYEIINDITLAIEGMLDPDTVEEYNGRAEVKDTFKVPRAGTIAGSLVIDGSIKKGCNVRLLRAGKIMFDGKMSSLKRFKDDVKEVKNSFECGIGLENYDDIKVGDLFEAYMMIEKKRTLEDVAKAEAAKEKAALEALAAAPALEE